MQRYAAIIVGSALLELLLAPPSSSAKVDCHNAFPEERQSSRSTREHAAVQFKPVEANGITYVTGGISPDDQQALQRMRKSYNVRISMRTPCGRANVGQLNISDAQGRTLVEAPAAGPIFLAKMPAGTYHLHVTSTDAPAVDRTISVPAHAKTDLRLTIAAPDRSVAGDAPISW